MFAVEYLGGSLEPGVATLLDEEEARMQREARTNSVLRYVCIVQIHVNAATCTYSQHEIRSIAAPTPAGLLNRPEAEEDVTEETLGSEDGDEDDDDDDDDDGQGGQFDDTILDGSEDDEDEYSDM
jgi:hypothetical protein